MTARYLLTITDADAAYLERWLNGRLIIGPAGDIHSGVPVARLDAVTDDPSSRESAEGITGLYWDNLGHGGMS